MPIKHGVKVRVDYELRWTAYEPHPTSCKAINQTEITTIHGTFAGFANGFLELELPSARGRDAQRILINVAHIITIKEESRRVK